MRITPSNLISFWPLILTELVCVDSYALPRVLSGLLSSHADVLWYPLTPLLNRFVSFPLRTSTTLVCWLRRSSLSTLPLLCCPQNSNCEPFRHVFYPLLLQLTFSFFHSYLWMFMNSLVLPADAEGDVAVSLRVSILSLSHSSTTDVHHCQTRRFRRSVGTALPLVHQHQKPHGCCFFSRLFFLLLYVLWMVTCLPPLMCADQCRSASHSRSDCSPCRRCAVTRCQP